jgi:succinoglycan biosynthesis protein ExoA
MTDTPLVSVIVPMRNEADTIEQLVEDVAKQDYHGPLELIVADGLSDDGSVGVLESASARLGVRVHVLENTNVHTAPALNLCLAHAQGEVIVRMDCHAHYASDYVSRCVSVLAETDAWLVGGRTHVEGRSAVQKAVASAMDSPFGGIGWSRASAEARAETDTVSGGAFPRAAFERAGGYDDRLECNEDEELALRIARAGGTIIVDSTIRSIYYPRSSLAALYKQYRRYGVWKPPIMLKHRHVFSTRSLVPSAFVLSLGGLALASLASVRARQALVAEVGVYAIAASTFAVLSVRRRGDSLALAPITAAAYPALHLGYGVGMLRGAFDALRRRASGREMHADSASADSRSDRR